MADEKKEGKFQGCCKGMPFAEMMRKMMAEGKSGSFNCADMIAKMVEASKAGSFNCAEMMSRMMEKCCGTAKQEKERV